jgi:hypothetical protein
MHKIPCNTQKLSCCLVFGVILLGILCRSSGSSAQQPTGTIRTFTGTVIVALQGKGEQPATVGTIVQFGDLLQTQSGASIVVQLSDGSELEIGENTKIGVAMLSQEPQTQARVSRLKLFWGRIRATLSPGHQKEGSSFTVETPNALAGVKFSHPVIEILYDPITQTTTIIAYTVDVIVTNLLTNEVKQIPRGQQGIVRGELILLSPIGWQSPPSPPLIQMLFQNRSLVRDLTSPSAPAATGVGHTETSRNPSPGRPAHQFRTVTIHVGEQ